MKRPAAAAASGALTVNKKVKIVGKALLYGEVLPGKVKEMINDILPGTLGVPKEERHPFQEYVVKTVGEVIAKMDASAAAEVAEIEAAIQTSTAGQATQEAAQQAAVAAVAQKTEAAVAAKTALHEATAGHKSAKEALATAETEQKDGDASLEAAGGKKTALDDLVTNHLAALKGSTCEDVKASVGTAAKVCKEFSMETELLTMFKSTLGKAPASWGTFDSIVLKQAEDFLTKVGASLTEELTKGTTAKAEREAKVTAAQAALTTAGEKEVAAKEALTAAVAAQKEAEESEKAAVKTLKEATSGLKELQHNLETAQKYAQDLKEGAVCMFQELVDRPAVPPPAPEEELAAEAPVAVDGYAAAEA